MRLPAPFVLFFVAVTAAAHTDPTAAILQELIRIDTSNPPGNEGKIAQFLKTKLAPLGFEIDIISTPDSAKAHFIARLKGDGTRKPVLLAAHADVVGVEREKWTADPFAGTISDGYVFGRGAIDFKGGLAVFLRAVMMLAENKIHLTRDVILLSEADEEGGLYNTLWLAKHNWSKIDCEFALNEGGWIIANADGTVRYVSISTADKASVSLQITAKGTSTHSSMPRPENAIYTLAQALVKIGSYETQPKLTAGTREFFSTLEKTSKPPLSTSFHDLINSTDPGLVQQADAAISKDPLLHAIMRNTIAPVFLDAGFRGNVIPGSASATLNFRVIPGTNIEELISEMKAVINDTNVDVTLAMGKGMPGTAASYSENQKLLLNLQPSSKETDLYRALVRQSGAVFPGVPVTAYLFQAGTDSAAWRSRGIPVYGIYPYPISAEDLTRMHGNDERVPIKSLQQGTELIYKTLLDVAAH